MLIPRTGRTYWRATCIRIKSTTTYVELVKEDVDADSDRSTRWKLSSPYTVEEKFAEEDQ